MPIRLLALVFMVASSTGCLLMNGDDDDCEYGGVPTRDGEGAAVYDPGIRNPDTGLCEYWNTGGGGECDACGNCPDAPNQDDRAPTPTWGSCESGCEGLDQATCETTGGCRAILTSACITADCQDTPVFAACWPTDTTGPVQGGGCEGLDAFSCSLHDDCSAVHQQDNGAAGTFGYCTPEGDATGGPGSCDGTMTCERVSPACPEGTTPGIANGCYTDYCIPLEDCGDGDPDPGSCYGPLTADGPAPACPEGTLPGRSNGLYTGYCIPQEACEEQPACAETIGEASCVARDDCTPIYEGVDCSCEADACECADWVFSHCE
jgi:hypothetical protein